MLQNMLVSNQLFGRSLCVEEKEYLFFSGTAYLGIPQNEQFQQHLFEGIRRYGTNWGSSRISNLQLDIFELAEKKLAGMAGAEAALTLSSGYLMCQMVIRCLEKEGALLYAPGAHPALRLKNSNIRAQEYSQWVARLPELIAATPEEHLILVANAVDALRVRQHDFSWVHKLPSHKNYTLLLDDSHGFGITGKEGGGVYSYLNVPAPIRFIVVSSLAKAMGLPGGVVFSDKDTIEQFRQSTCFSGSSPIVPAYLYAFVQAGPLYKELRERLQKHIQYFTTALGPLHGFQTFHNYPVFYTPRNGLCEQLKQKDILISSFPYPLPTDAPITRIVLNSQHRQEDIERLVQALKEVPEPS